MTKRNILFSLILIATFQAPLLANAKAGCAVGGAVLGGVLGHQVGGGSGKDAATAIGIMTGAILGDRARCGEEQQQSPPPAPPAPAPIPVPPPMNDHGPSIHAINYRSQVFTNQEIIATNDRNQSFYGHVVGFQRNGNPVVSLDNGFLGEWERYRLALAEGCSPEFCTRDQVTLVDSRNQYFSGLVRGVNFDGSLIVEIRDPRGNVSFFGTWALNYVIRNRR